MSTHHLLLVSIALTIIISSALTFGITIDLIHRDALTTSNSTTSNVYKPYSSLQRSIKRARALTRASLAVPVIPGGGEYIMDLSIGTPPSRFLGILDTGSDLTWTQCAPCQQCFKQEIPVYDPAKSSSYAPLTCDSHACDALTGTCTAKKTCAYKYGYGDKSSTVGDLAAETLTLGSDPTGRVAGFAFGCGHINTGLFTRQESGLVGLGQGPLSLTSQTKKLPAFGGKFAYCLVPFEKESAEGAKGKISFGDDAIVKGDDVVSTPMVSGQVDSFYYLTLEGVSVGEKNIPFKNSYGSGSGLDLGPEGNIIIDSGTTLTLLPGSMFDDVVAELKSQIKTEPVPDPTATLQLCYEGDVVGPDVVFHFTGASLAVRATNMFFQVTDKVACFGVLPANQMAIFGNLAQINFVVSYDVAAKTVSFKATDCTTFV